MKADLTRISFHPLKHYARVVMQQGRVQLDADWNEQVAIILRYMRALAKDVYGPAGRPSGNLGFTIRGISSDNFTIEPGHYYVDGILCECEAGSKPITYLHQPDYPGPVQLTAGKKYQVYLDVWERLITFVEDESIREVALGGPDTAARTKIIWQVKVLELTQKEGSIDVKWLNDTFQGENRGFLRVTANVKSVSTDPCVIAPDARYRGPENQLYRVEVHSPGPVRGAGSAVGGATFKWSRENACVVFPIISLAGTKATLENLGRDDRFGLVEGDWVEVEDDDYVLQNWSPQSPPGPLLRVQSIDRSAMEVTLNGTPAKGVGTDPTKHPLLRRWDQKEGDPAEGGLQLASDCAALILEDSDGTWLDLENGIQIQFQKPHDQAKPNEYRSGDYWLIPARTVTGGVEWPTSSTKDGKMPVALPPDGVTHHYAPLATITPGQGKEQPEASSHATSAADWIDKPGQTP
jgi:hypothetical protein